MGPYMILKKINEVTYHLMLPHVSQLKPVTLGPLASYTCASSPLEPLDIEAQPAYTVHAFLDSCRRNGGLEYLMEWEGYSPKEQCFISAKDILDPMLTQEIDATHSDKSSPYPRGHPHTCSAPGTPDLF